MNNTQTVQTPTAPADSGSGEEMGTLLADIRSGWSSISVLPAEFKSLQENTEKLSVDLRELKRGWLSRINPPGPRPRGQVSEACARFLAAQLIALCERCDKLEALA